MEEEEEEDQREMARTKETKRMEPSAETDKSHLGKRDTRNALTDRRIDDLVTIGQKMQFLHVFLIFLRVGLLGRLE